MLCCCSFITNFWYMDKITCFVVEDEPVSRSLLVYFISQYPELHLIADFDNAAEAMAAYKKEAVDLLFLDINLGGESGIDLAHKIDGKSLIVFTTAHREFAPEAFNLNAADYLVKPVENDRFGQCIEKIKMLMDARRLSDEDENTIFIKDSRGMVKINVPDISYIESLGDYLKIHVREKFYTMLGTMKEMEQKMKPFGFLRVHRSYLVNLKRITSTGTNFVMLGHQKIRVSDSNKAELQAAIAGKRII